MKRLKILCLFLCSVSVALAQEVVVEQVKFSSKGDLLAGSLVIPVNIEIKAALVFVHGSGKQQRSMHWAKRFAAQGIAAFVYDKRGAGESGGEYESKQSVSEKNIRLLTADALAAFDVISEHPITKDLPLGLSGISQAGWIVPLAAKENDAVDFIVLWSAPVVKVSEEDIFSKYTKDLDNQIIPSYQEALTARKQKYVWPKFLGEDTNPSKSLLSLKIPGLWIFGRKDGSVPVDLSLERLERLINSGHQFEHVVFSASGHNNMDETFTTATEWIKRQFR